jgi:Ca2+-binding RTX toxin-like protein
MATYTGTAAADHIVGSGAADTISGRGGNDTLEGRAGNDTITGGGGADTLIGGTGNDVLSGGAGKDLFLFAAGDGQDRVTDLASGDVVRITGYSSAQSITQVGTDVVVTLSGSDKMTFSSATVATVKAALQFGSGTSGGTTGMTITGTNNGDTLNGTAGDDVIKGLGGYDVIHGGGGNDRIYGGLGGDGLWGGAGADVFVYTSTAEAPPYGLIYTEWDTIHDFQSIDKIDLSAIDIDPTVAGKQSLHFVGITDGVNIPDHSAGALYIAKNGDYVWIEAFLNGDGYPDLNIDIYGPDASNISASNLIL